MNNNEAVNDSFLGFAIYYLIFSLTDMLGTKLGLGKETGFFFGGLGAVLALFFILYTLVHKSTGNKNTIETTSKNNSRDLLIGISTGIVMGSVVVIGMFNHWNGLFSLFSIEYLQTKLFPTGVINIILFVLVFVIAIPIAEEMFFRGFMFPALEIKYNVIIATFITAVLSSIFLSGSISFLFLFFAGVVFAILYQKTRAVFCSIVSHMALNFIITLIIFIKGGS